MATGDRVLVGKKGSDYGLWVSKPSGNVLSDADVDLLFSSENTNGIGQTLLFQQIDMADGTSSPTTTTQNYNNRGGGKTFFYWWNGTTTSYAAASGFLTSTAVAVTNKYVNATTNQIEITNSGAAASIIVLVINKAAA